MPPVMQNKWEKKRRLDHAVAGTSQILSFFVTTTAGEDETSGGNRVTWRSTTRRIALSFNWADCQPNWERRPANRSAFGGTVPLFYQMSRVPLNHGDVPLFVRSRIFVLRARAQFVTLPRCPDANHPIERNCGIRHVTVPIATRILIANVRHIGVSNICVINLVYFKMQVWCLWNRYKATVMLNCSQYGASRLK